MPDYRVLVTGDRKWSDPKMIDIVLKAVAELRPFDNIVVVHGAARGADTYADVVARARGYRVEKYPADWEQYGRAAGPIRNKQMLDTGINLVVAFHDKIEQSKGTKHMIDIAVKAGVKVALFKHEHKR